MLPLLLASVSLAADLTVCSTGCSHTSIGAATAAAAAGDRVVVGPGVWNEWLQISTTAVEVRSLAGSWHTTLASPGGAPAIRISASGTRVQGFTITSADPSQPLVQVDANQSAILHDLTVFGHSGTVPLVEAGDASLVQISGSRFSQNSGSHGISGSDNGVVLLESEIDNHTLTTGGFIEGDGSQIEVRRSVIREVLAPSGAVVSTTGTLTLDEVLMESGQASDGGAAQVRTTNATVEIVDSSFWTGLGGSIGTSGGHLTLTNTAFHGPDGAVELQSTAASVQQVRFQGVDTPGDAPLSASGANLTVSRSVFAYGSGDAGALQLDASGSVTIEETAFIGNSGGLAGAIDVHDTDGALTYSFFCDNTASTTAPPSAGGLRFDASGHDWSVEHTVFARNSTNSSGGGAVGALVLDALTVDYTTFRNDTAGTNGGESVATNTLSSTFTNTMFVNPGADDFVVIDGGSASGDHNLWRIGGGPGTCLNCDALPGPNDLFVNPNLPSIDGLTCDQMRFAAGSNLAGAGSDGRGLGATAVPTGATNVFADADGDGFNALLDCDDADATVFPGAPERCNGVDDDCDRQIDLWDEPAASEGRVLYPDTDHDGVGAPGDPTGASRPTERVGCEAPPGWSPLATDCNDADFRITGGPEIQGNGLDDDCDPSTPDTPTGDTGDPGDTAAAGDTASPTDSGISDTAEPDAPGDSGSIDTSSPRDSGGMRPRLWVGGAGCGCAGAPGPSGWALGLLALLGLFRRSDARTL